MVRACFRANGVSVGVRVAHDDDRGVDTLRVERSMAACCLGIALLEGRGHRARRVPSIRAWRATSGGLLGEREQGPARTNVRAPAGVRLPTVR